MPEKKVVYKTIDNTELALHVFNPKGHKLTDKRPAIVFFFGGGWMGGNPKQFYQQAKSFAALGFVAMSAEYRVIGKHKTTPFECVQDGKSAVRWIRQHAAELGVDPDRIVAAGGSAGGHVAACIGVIQGHEEEGENTNISAMPNAMILYNPVVDTTEKGYGMNEVGEQRKTEISPCHNVRKGIPPTLVFHGTADRIVPFENVERFTQLMKDAGNRCILVPFEKKGHGFFNGSFFRPKNGDDDFSQCMNKSVEFLSALGFVRPQTPSNTTATTAAKPTRVVCVGDSITAGPYPEMLQNELGKGWVTVNCGQGAATVIEGTLRPYQNSPNIIVFLVDDMGVADTSVPFNYDGGGNPVTYNLNHFYVTPNMETLASMGMKFTQAYATPACTSTRVSLMTGFNTLRHGVCMQVNPTGVIAPNAVSPFTTTHSTPNDWKRTGMNATDAATSMPKVLSDAGYRSIFSGKGHFGSSGSFAADPLAVGFDVNRGGSHRGAPSSYTGNYGNNLPNLDAYENTGTFLTDALTQALNEEIEDAVNDGVPFFAYMSHYAVHSPFTTDPNATGDYSSGVSRSHRSFATMIEGMDQSLGDILTKLDELGIAENTLIIFLGDNGSDSPAATQDGFASGAFSDFPLRGKKATEWEGGIRVPMLVSWAKRDASNTFQAALPIAAGSREDDIVTVWDIFPTVLGVTGVAAPHALDGYDLSHYLQGSPGTHRPQEMLMYWPNDHNEDYFAIFRDENWKLIYRFATDRFELYDLDADPTEASDLAVSNPDRVMRMARRMAQEFDAGWGTLGPLWPTFAGASRPYTDDPFAMPSLPEVDIDQDGIADIEEDPNNNGLIDAGETDPDNQDSDQDNTLDGDEVRTGRDPLDPSSFFAADILSRSATEIQLSWPSAPGAFYQIESSTTLSGWGTELDNIPAEDPGSSTSRTLAIPAETSNWFLRSVLLPASSRSVASHPSLPANVNSGWRSTLSPRRQTPASRTIPWPKAHA